ncbi:MAG: hypothetical protein K2P51_02230 [Rhabdochlamydiaceae bacterium]|nr:hypothetical protein [Rhabdochlamydiaceae bacterium]
MSSIPALYGASSAVFPTEDRSDPDHSLVSTQLKIKTLLADRPAHLVEKDGQYWKCLERRQDEEGYIYRFVYIENDLVFDASPAEEPGPDDLLNGAYIIEPEDIERLIPFGYTQEKKCGLSYIELPDQIAQLCRAERQGLSGRLSVVDFQGFADDLDFAKYVALGQVVLSSGAQFVHDHIFHVRVRLVNLLHDRDTECDEFQQQIFRLIEICERAERILEHSPNGICDYTIDSAEGQLHSCSLEQSAQFNQKMLARLKALTGAAADYLSSITFASSDQKKSFTSEESSIFDLVEETWAYYDFGYSYFSQRFKGDGLGDWPIGDSKELQRFIKQIISKSEE